MIIDIRMPRLPLPRLYKWPSHTWQRWWIILPRLAYVDGSRRRQLLLPGRYETRISIIQNRRVWREIGKGAQHG